MGFYYLSISSLLLLGVVYTVLLLLFLGIARVTRGMRGRKALLGVVGTVFLILPIAEELWIAWHFGQACKQAGTFIYKKVEVEGFYDDTGGGTMTRLVGRPPYQFIESRESGGKYRRVEHASAEERSRALAWYSEKNPGKQPGPKEWITHPVSDRVHVTVEIDTGYAWRITQLDRPTARYHYKDTTPMNGTPWAHKVGKTESVVIDTETNEEIARYTAFGRRPPWFWIGLDTPAFACDAPGRWPYARGNPLVYRNALIPAGQR